MSLHKFKNIFKLQICYTKTNDLGRPIGQKTNSLI